MVWDWTSAAQWVGNGSLGALEETVAEQKQQIGILLGRKDPVS